MSLRVKFSLAIAGLIVMMVMVLGAVLTQRIAILVREAVLKKGEALVDNLSANVREGLLTEDELLVAQLLDQVARDAAVLQAAVLEPGGRLMAHTDHTLKRGVVWVPPPMRQDSAMVFERPITVHGRPIGRAVLVMSTREVHQAVDGVRRTITGVAALLLGLGVVTALVMIRYITEPLKVLTRGVEQVGAGDLKHQIPVTSSDEIGDLTKAFNVMTSRLEKAQEELLAQDRLRQELRIAKEIQSALLPKEFPRIQGFEVSARYQSAEEVGGDYYDFFWVDHRRLGCVIADVSGKGVPGALGMTVTRNILRSKAVGRAWPSQVLAETNRLLRDNLKRGMFVTMFYAILDVREKTLLCANAGHHPLLVFRRGGGYEVVDPPGMALGLSEGPEFEHSLSDITVQLYESDMCILYSDGVSEAVNAQGEEYGERRLIHLLERRKGGSLDDLLKEVQDDLTTFTAGRVQHDDITLVGMKVDQAVRPI